MSIRIDLVDSYKRYIKILIVLLIGFFLMRFFAAFEFLYEIIPNRNFRGLISRIEGSLNSGSMIKIFFHSCALSSFGYFIGMFAFILCLLKITRVTVNNVSFLALKPLINMDALEVSNPFLYANKTRSLRE